MRYRAIVYVNNDEKTLALLQKYAKQNGFDVVTCLYYPTSNLPRSNMKQRLIRMISEYKIDVLITLNREMITTDITCLSSFIELLNKYGCSCYSIADGIINAGLQRITDFYDQYE